MKPIGLVPELLVKEIKKSLDFYVNILGFTVLYERSTEHFAYIQKGNSEIMLEQVGIGRNFITGDLQHPFGRGINFQIEVGDVDQLYKNILNKKIKVFLEMEEKWYTKIDFEVGNRQFCVQDPDGYLLRFYKNLGQREIKK